MCRRRAGIITAGAVPSSVPSCSQPTKTSTLYFIYPYEHLPNSVRDIASHPHRKQVFRSSWMTWTSAHAVPSSVPSLPIPLSTRRDASPACRPMPNGARAVPSSWYNPKAMLNTMTAVRCRSQIIQTNQNINTTKTRHLCDANHITHPLWPHPLRPATNM